MGAAPEPAASTRLNPNFLVIDLNEIFQVIKSITFAKRSLNPFSNFLSAAYVPSFRLIPKRVLFNKLASFIFTRTLECILSSILGTAAKKVGCICIRSSCTVSIDSAILIVAKRWDPTTKSINLPKI